MLTFQNRVTSECLSEIPSVFSLHSCQKHAGTPNFESAKNRPFGSDPRDINPQRLCETEMKNPILFWVVVFLSGCSATYQQDIVKSPQSTLSRGKGIFIATPKNGWYGKTEYRNSGKMTADAVKAAFARFSINVIVSEKCFGLDCLKVIATEHYEYYVQLEILHWEDRATEWSGLPDRIEVKISVYDSRLGTELASSILSARSKWATLGGDHPQDLLPEPVTQYVESLYGVAKVDR